jgi:hypothetical protein
MDVMELAGRLAQQHAQELKEVLRLEGDRANQARHPAPGARPSPPPHPQHQHKQQQRRGGEGER